MPFCVKGVRSEGISHQATAGRDKSDADSPTREVLGNYELLENVLSCLRFEDLMRAKKVNMTFNNLISSQSKTLRKRLFLEPGEFELEYQVPEDPQPEEHHPLRRENFRSDRDWLRSLFYASSQRGPITFNISTEQSHPLLEADGFFFVEKEEPIQTIEWKSRMAWNDAERLLNTRGQAWESMYATQPPKAKVELYLDQYQVIKGIERRAGMESTCVENSEGVRLGDIVDCLRDLLAASEPDRRQREARAGKVRTEITLFSFRKLGEEEPDVEGSDAEESKD